MSSIKECIRVASSEGMNDLAKEADDELLELARAVRGVMKSFECYCATNKPEIEWDEYDYMMFPAWKRLQKIADELEL